MATDIKKTNAEELSYMDIVRKEGNIKIPLFREIMPKDDLVKR